MQRSGDATAGLEAYAKEFPTARYVAFFLARRATSPEVRAFIAAYTAAFKEEPDQRAALVFAEVNAVAGPRYARGDAQPEVVRWGAPRGSIFLADQQVPILSAARARLRGAARSAARDVRRVPDAAGAGRGPVPHGAERPLLSRVRRGGRSPSS